MPSKPNDQPLPTLVGAIDAGSNGIRFAIGRIQDDGSLVQVETTRESVRLGGDAFSAGAIGELTMDAAVAAFSRFAERITINGIKTLRAVATSAVRDSTNGASLVERIRSRTGIELEVIDGLEEAHLIFLGVATAVDMKDRTALLIDMGGGSIEVTVARDGVALGSKGFPLGAVRLLTRLKAEGANEAEVEELLSPFEGAVAELIATQLKRPEIDVCVGTGGNLETLGRLRGPMLGKSQLGKVKLSDLDPMIGMFLEKTPEQRSAEWDLRADRADVIAIAAIVLRMLLREAQVKKALTPGVGLVQGLLWELADRARGSRP